MSASTLLLSSLVTASVGKPLVLLVLRTGTLVLPLSPEGNEMYLLAV